ncbi:S41 family peptidase [Algoriphagus sp. AGSA1]|uniref:S41 family peptidase n=1 Tax=Algoriphagus sp. AGSA1 TaxID=2907213 RepID=UPI001F1616BD|nr:S41 family peptidase [Algoriphagus sp. AGSA1]MCE7053187.1 S41 family peptidase [Algoriphagus sp. AGSA1]
MKNIFVLLFLLISLNCYAQEADKFNLGFENQVEGNVLSTGWFKWGEYTLSTDSIAYSGKKAGKIASSEAGGAFGSIVYKIPAKYKGNTIKLEGYMKIKEVENGFAGLMLRIDGGGSSLAFDNMQNQNISGTKDWQKYSITLPYPEQAENIFLGGILAGNGEVWFDDFVVSIDGEDIQTLPEVRREVTKASLDHEFDQGSGIEFGELTAENISDLELLGRVWGFLKYHHPEIAKGNYNWDYELFRFLPKYLEATDAEERDRLIINWIDALGQLEKCASCKPTDQNAYIKPDFTWIENQDEDLRDKLRTLYNHRSQGSHYYIKMAVGVGNPEFNNESSYPSMSYPDAGFRLLSLFRYWNMIHYFFPYKHLMDKSWDTAIKEYIPFFLNAENELEYELATLQIIGDIQDTHANLWRGGDKIDEWKGRNYPPVHVRFIEDKLVVIDYYKADLKKDIGLEIGDIITKINGQSIEEIIKEESRYYPASNVPTQLRDISSDILRSNLNEIEISYISGSSAEQTKTLKLYPQDSLGVYRWYRPSNAKSFKMLDNNIGYVTLQTIKEEDISQIKEEFRDTRGIIIDIRNYPSTFVVFSLGSYFLSEPSPFVKFTGGNINNPGEFNLSDAFTLPTSGDTYQGKLVVLVNELSQSQAEYTAMAFRAGDNTTIIGSTTAGADGNVSTILLPGGLQTSISGLGIYYPNGEETQRVGIVPDIIVEPTIEGIREGRDELMEKAIEILLRD